jgi:AcrR family transcriptional regulator
MSRRASNAGNTTSSPGDETKISTRQLLLTAAGVVFAEKGYDRATSREICDAAGVNTAAANYYFGGVEGLYAAALAHAHQRLIRIDVLRQIASSGSMAPRAKLKLLIDMMVERLTRSPAGMWELRLLAREILAPTALRAALIDRELLPKIGVLREILSEIMGLSPDDPRVGRSIVSFVAPHIMMMVCDRRILDTLIQGFGDGKVAAEPLAEHLLSYALAGLSAIAGLGNDNTRDTEAK